MVCSLSIVTLNGRTENPQKWLVRDKLRFRIFVPVFKIFHQLGAGDAVGIAGEIFYFGGGGQLSSGLQALK